MGASSTLSKLSLGLGVVSAALVFGIGLCALTGARGGWLGPLATILFICGGSSAFLGLLGMLTGLGGLISDRQARGTAAVGLILSLLGMCMFIAFLAQFGG
jgi:hypothetical protein